MAKKTLATARLPPGHDKRTARVVAKTRLDSVVGTKKITLTDAAYKRLHALKREGETLSDVVDRLTGPFALRETVGILSETEGQRLKAARRSFGRRFRKGIGARSFR